MEKKENINNNKNILSDNKIEEMKIMIEAAEMYEAFATNNVKKVLKLISKMDKLNLNKKMRIINKCVILMNEAEKYIKMNLKIYSFVLRNATTLEMKYIKDIVLEKNKYSENLLLDIENNNKILNKKNKTQAII